MLMMKLVSILLLQRFRLVPVAPIPPLDFSRATLAQRAGPCLISLVPIER